MSKTEMKREDIERLLEALEDTCFPIQIDWNKKDLYIKGLAAALNKIEQEDLEKKAEPSILD